VLIPAIDLQAGQVVQLVQGERLALAFDDVEQWIDRFRRYPLVQVIDLDAARRCGSNASLVARICGERPCRVGGGIHTVEAAETFVAAGAREVIFGSALFSPAGVNVTFAARASARLGLERVVAAIDSRGGRVTVAGWAATAPVTPLAAVRLLEPYVGGFLYTLVEGEGLMRGIDVEAVRQIRAATTRRVTAGGGIRSRDEIEQLEAIGVDAVVGMALYTGRIRID
jgi:phosphoribosylformimino-5-aminoimidazole carboxamide ribotide isomerase